MVHTLLSISQMTRAMIEDTFGSGTEVCKFVGVTTAEKRHDGDPHHPLSQRI
jgi:hypothetical protein